MKSKVDVARSSDDQFFSARTSFGNSELDIGSPEKKEDTEAKEDAPPDSVAEEISRLRKIVIMVVFSVGMYNVFASITSIAPFYASEAKKKGASNVAAGFVLGVFDLGTVVSASFIPRLGCKIKPNILIPAGLILAGTATFIFGFTNYIQGGMAYLAVCFLIRIFNGAGSACFQITSYVVVSMIYPDRVGTAYSILETAVGLGVVTGPLLGGALYEQGGYLAPFALTGSCQILSGILSFFLIPTLAKNDPAEELSLLKFVRHFHPLICGLAIITTELLSGFLAGSISTFAEQFNVSSIFVALIFVAEGAAYTFTSPMWGYLNDHWLDPHLGCLVGFCLCAIGYFFVGPSILLPMNSSLGLTIGAVVFCGLGEAAGVINAYNAMLMGAGIRGYPQDRRMYSLASVVFNMACSTGAFIGPVAGGYIEGSIGLRTGSMIIVVMELIMIVLFVVFNIVKRVRGLPIKPDFVPNVVKEKPKPTA